MHFFEVNALVLSEYIRVVLWRICLVGNGFERRGGSKVHSGRPRRVPCYLSQEKGRFSISESGSVWILPVPRIYNLALLEDIYIDTHVALLEQDLGRPPLPRLPCDAVMYDP